MHIYGLEMIIYQGHPSLSISHSPPLFLVFSFPRLLILCKQFIDFSVFLIPSLILTFINPIYLQA